MEKVKGWHWMGDCEVDEGEDGQKEGRNPCWSDGRKMKKTRDNIKENSDE